MISMCEVYQARKRIGGRVHRTPLVHSPSLSREIGSSIYLKLESLQKTGSFKVRGAFNKILSLTQMEKEKGVITFSTGNHGRAVAYAARRGGERSVVCVSEHVPTYRVKAIQDLGAETVVRGRSQDEAEAYYHRLKEERNLCEIRPFDDPLIIAGQATIGLEIMEDLPEVDTVLVPLSGGGLLSGIALVLKSSNPSIRVVGVSIERSPAMLESAKAGIPLRVEEKDTLADSLLGGIGMNNRYTLQMVRDLVDEHLLVNEEEIALGMAYALKNHGLVVEGAGAVGIGTLLTRKLKQPGKQIAVLVSGSNVDLPQYLDVMRKYLSKKYEEPI